MQCCVQDGHKSVGLNQISFRPMTVDDLGTVPLDCHGRPTELLGRLGALGAAAILAFDGAQHVAQLQFRRHQPNQRSAAGMFSPDYWGDFEGRAPNLPVQTLCVYCYHVGQLTDGMARDARYQGHGLGLALLDELIAWARSQRFEAIVAKAVPADKRVSRYMGGQSEQAYLSRGFKRLDRWIDHDVHDALVERGVIGRDSDPEATAGMSLCVLDLKPS
jgi:GNAT superfamily N-acetyltransferase